MYIYIALHCCCSMHSGVAQRSSCAQHGSVGALLTAGAQQQGRAVHAADGLSAATALRHGLPVMIRNVSHFEPTDALPIYPW